MKFRSCLLQAKEGLTYHSSAQRMIGDGGNAKYFGLCLHKYIWTVIQKAVERVVGKEKEGNVVESKAKLSDFSSWF